MQVVGRTCEVCSVAVTLEKDAEGCAKCDLVYHSRCTKRRGRCDACGGSMEGFESAKTADEVVAEARYEADLRRGRTFLLLAGGLHVGIDALYAGLIVLSGFPADASKHIPALLNVMLSASLLYFAYRGKQWGRLVLGGIAVLSGGGLVWVSAGNSSITLIGALRLIAGGILLWVGDVRDFVHEQRVRR